MISRLRLQDTVVPAVTQFVFPNKPRLSSIRNESTLAYPLQPWWLANLECETHRERRLPHHWTCKSKIPHWIQHEHFNRNPTVERNSPPSYPNALALRCPFEPFALPFLFSLSLSQTISPSLTISARLHLSAVRWHFAACLRRMPTYPALKDVHRNAGIMQPDSLR